MTQSDNRLSLRTPASLFGVVLGLAGLSNAWRAAHATWGLPASVGEGLFFLAGAAWIVIASLDTFGRAQAPQAARAEAEDPVQCCFIGLAGVSTLLIAQGALAFSRTLAIAFFAIGVGVTVAFALWRTGRLWRGDRSPGST